MHDWLQNVLALSAHSSLYVMVVLALGTLISEDIACVAAGLLVADGSLSFAAAVSACFVGIVAGDLTLVMVGRTVGRRAVAVAPLRWVIDAGALTRAERWFSQRGLSVMMASRFMPGTRLPTYLAAGVLRAPLLTFTWWFVVAGAIWTPLLVGAAVVLGEGASRLFVQWASAVPGLIAAGIVAYLLSRLGIALSTHRGRRLLRGRWCRITRWEFWPRWAVYPPVVLYILWLGIRHRSLTLPTAVNPGIGHGSGLIGESKAEILRGLADAVDAVARWTVVDSARCDDPVASVRAFMSREGIAFPIVLKPDVGERGSGVVIVRDERALEAAFRADTAKLIAQEYVPGVEFGVFYFRRPSQSRGEILAITDKRVAAVIGDGRQTLEELILNDERAVCMAEYFIGAHVDHLEEVPASGERVALSELGTHCRGSLFLDGTHLVTPALEDAIERVSQSFRGFNFGRYDIRAESEAAFQRGEFKVIELNGLTSEATNIYDPRHSVWHGWRMLCRQWRIAFEIADEHRGRGVRPHSLRETWRIIAQPRTAR